MYIIQIRVIAVCDNAVTHFFELIQIIYNFTSEKGDTIFESWFVNDNSCALRLDTLHDTLNTALAEVVGIAFHGKSVDTYNNFFLFGNIPLTVGS